MLITIEDISNWFDRFNNAYFYNKLPKPKFVVTNSRNILGQFECTKKRRGLFRHIVRTDFVIRISSYYDIPECEYCNLLLHEMIHYHIAYHNLGDTSTHGPKFRSFMEQLNSLGWNISIRARTTKWSVAKRNRRSLHNVLVLETIKGQFIMVVHPDYLKRIDAIAANTSSVIKHTWYISKDEYFDSFPRARSLRGQRISYEELNRVFVNGKTRGMTLPT